MATSAEQQATKTKAQASPWRGFRSGLWQKQVDVRDFIQQNYEPVFDASTASIASLGAGLANVERVACATFRDAGLEAY